MRQKGRVERKSKPQWFGSTVSAATNASPVVPYDPFPTKLREKIQPHIEKATRRRKEALLAIRNVTDKKGSAGKYDSWMELFRDSLLSHEGQFGFDTLKYPLRDAFQKSCAIPQGVDLSRIHLEEKIHKLKLLQNLTQNPAEFQVVYDDFVRAICCPRLAQLWDCRGEIHYQCFPCIRIVKPGDFSIGPHADVAYGHHPFTTNFYVLLTNLSQNESSAALFLESKPGTEDWHPILGDYGETVKHFAGAVCAHWATENNTDVTRVSIDFRLIPGPLFNELADGGEEAGGQVDVYRQTAGYYQHCHFVEDHWQRSGPLVSPDVRVGFPWTVSDWEKLLAEKGGRKQCKK